MNGGLHGIKLDYLECVEYQRCPDWCPNQENRSFKLKQCLFVKNYPNPISHLKDCNV